MRTFLCSLNSKYIHSSLAVWYLKKSTDTNCPSDIRTKVVEYTVNQPANEILCSLTEHNPDVLAMSCYIWNISAIQSLVLKIKKALPAVRIILGGPEVSYNPEDLLKDMPETDFIIAGEGEIPFPMLLNALYRGGGFSHIPGLCFRNGDKICRSLQSPPILEPPSPYGKDYFAALCGRIAYLETSRGCPFSCAFCLSGQSGATVRFFDMDRAKKELIALASSGTRTVKLVDRTFNCNPGRAYELFDFLIKSAGNLIPPGVCFHFEVAADLFDAQTLRLLSTSPPGLIQLEAGIQSFNPDTLAAVSRKTDIQKAEENIKSLIFNGNIHLHADLIAGLPREGLDSFAASFNRAYALSPHMLQLGFLKMLHGSDLRRNAQAIGYSYSKNPPYEVQSSPWLSPSEISILRQTEYALNHLHNSGRFSLTIEYVLQATAFRPFDFFRGFGESLHHSPSFKNQSLDAFTKAAFSSLSALRGIEKARLRDALVCDRIASGQKIPGFLKIPDPALKTALTHIKNKYYQGKKEAPIRAALLYSGQKRAVFAFGSKNPVTGRYPLLFEAPPSD